MSEMVERVARALRALPVRDYAQVGGELDELRLREAARAAIEAMREPTEGMVKAGENTVCIHGDPQCGAAYAWAAMIDAALSDTTGR